MVGSVPNRDFTKHRQVGKCGALDPVSGLTKLRRHLNGQPSSVDGRARFALELFFAQYGVMFMSFGTLITGSNAGFLMHAINLFTKPRELKFVIVSPFPRSICNYIIVMTKFHFTWDEAKARSNRKKHGVSFEEAARVFFDPLHLSIQDRVEGDEQRWQTLGMVDGVTILLVAHLFIEEGPESPGFEVIRIISARRATRK